MPPTSCSTTSNTAAPSCTSTPTDSRPARTSCSWMMSLPRAAPWLPPAGSLNKRARKSQAARCWMNREAFEETVRTGRAVYFSRSRKRLWRKGEESGNVQEVKEIYIDCDADAVLLKVNQIGGAACHEGYKSCFFRKLDGDKLTTV